MFHNGFLQFLLLFKVNIVAEHVNAKRMYFTVRVCTELKKTVVNSFTGGKRAFAPPWYWD